MNRFFGESCQVCHEEFKDGDDVVVCAECGAPYHRDCIKQHGSCVYESKHAEGYTFKSSRENRESDEQDNSSEENLNKCPRCGTVNNKDSLFCSVCGKPLSQSFSNRGYGNMDDENAGFQGNAFQGFAGYGSYSFEQIKPEDKIEGVAAKDLAAFVGENIGYFIPRFKIMSENKRANVWNFSALITTYIYFAYRKMWGPAIITFLMHVLISVPEYIIVFTGSDSPFLLTLSMVSAFLTVALRVVVGAFANRIYFKHSVRKVKSLTVKYENSPNMSQQLLRHGSVSRNIVFVIMMISVVLSFVMVYLTGFSGMAM